MNAWEAMQELRSRGPAVVEPAASSVKGRPALQVVRRAALADAGARLWGEVANFDRVVWLGTGNGLGFVVYSRDPWFDRHPEELRPIARELGQLLGAPTPRDAALLRAWFCFGPREYADLRPGRVADSLTGGRVVRWTSTWIRRADLPGGRLVDTFVPLWVDDDEYAMIAVADAWPGELRARWQAAPDDRPGAGPARRIG